MNGSSIAETCWWIDTTNSFSTDRAFVGDSHYYHSLTASYVLRRFAKVVATSTTQSAISRDCRSQQLLVSEPTRPLFFSAFEDEVVDAASPADR